MRREAAEHIVTTGKIFFFYLPLMLGSVVVYGKISDRKGRGRPRQITLSGLMQWHGRTVYKTVIKHKGSKSTDRLCHLAAHMMMLLVAQSSSTV